MKTYRIILVAIALLFAMPTAWAQTTKREQRKIERAERKRLKAEEKQKNQEMLIKFVEDQTFVLEANTLAGRYNQYSVSPTTNFIKIAGDQIVVQTAANYGFGYNGLGGITIKGTITDYKVTEEKNGAGIFIQFTDPVFGFSTLKLGIQPNGNARAMVVSNWGNRATFQGQVFSLEDSRIYKGQSLN